MTPDLDVVVVGGGRRRPLLGPDRGGRGRPSGAGLRKPLAESSSFWAQGGLAAALGADDSPELHAEDTLAAGRGACRRSAAELLARGGARRGRRAASAAASSSTSIPTAELALGLEGGHSRRRMVHAGGAGTGRRITERLAELSPASTSASTCSRGPRRWRSGATATRCHGVITDAGPIAAPATVLATGGGRGALGAARPTPGARSAPAR